jgi:CRISPR-associated protein Cmr4
MASRSFAPRAILGLYTETSLHCGTESGSGYVDMPVQRERHSGFPMIPGSTIKGVLNDEGRWGENRAHFFGADEKSGANPGDPRIPGRPGSVSFGDAFLVAFPVRSSRFPFVWITCPVILDRTYRALGRPWPNDVKRLKEGEAWSTAEGSEVLLEELQVSATRDGAPILAPLTGLLPQSQELAYTRGIFQERLYAISDQDFSKLIETATEIVTRIRIDEKSGTTSQGDGQLFNEELVPRDTLFLSVLRELNGSKPEFRVDDIPPVIRLGGHETIGRGVTWVNKVPLDNGTAKEAAA